MNLKERYRAKKKKKRLVENKKKIDSPVDLFQTERKFFMSKIEIVAKLKRGIKDVEKLGANIIFW